MNKYSCFLKCTARDGTLPARPTVYEATSKYKVHLTQLKERPNGFEAIVNSQTDVETLLTEKLKTSLSLVNLLPITPKDLVDKRTRFIRGIETHLGQQPAPTILADLKKSNPRLRVEDVIKFPNLDRCIKIVFRDSDSAEKAIKEGIFLGHQRIPPPNVQYITTATVTTCYICYALDSHNTKECPTPDVIICSNCNSDNHTHKNCPAQERICINCTKQGTANNHHTLAMSCPLRKKAMQDKKRALQQASRAQSSPTAYSNALQQGLLSGPPLPRPLMSIPNPRPPLLPSPNTQQSAPISQPSSTAFVINNIPVPLDSVVFTRQEMIQMHGIIIDAHVAATEHPTKTYKEIVEEAVFDSFGHHIKFPNHTHSRAITKAIRTSSTSLTVDDPAKINRPGEPPYEAMHELFKDYLPRENTPDPPSAPSLPRSRSTSPPPRSRSSSIASNSSSNNSSTASFTSLPASPAKSEHDTNTNDETTHTDNTRNQKRHLSLSPDAINHTALAKRRP